jgi:hypothetical protein
MKLAVNAVKKGDWPLRNRSLVKLRRPNGKIWAALGLFRTRWLQAKVNFLLKRDLGPILKLDPWVYHKNIRKNHHFKRKLLSENE